MSHGRLHRVCVSEDSSSPNRASSWWNGGSGRLFRGGPSVTRKQTWAHFPPLAFGPVGRAIADQPHRTARSPLGLFEMKDTKAEEKTREAPNAVRQHRPGGQAGAWQETSDSRTDGRSAANAWRVPKRKPSGTTLWTRSDLMRFNDFSGDPVEPALVTF